MPPSSFSRSFANQLTSLLRQKRVTNLRIGWIVLLLAFALGGTQFVSLVRVWASRTKPVAEKLAPSRLSEDVSVRADRSNSAFKLSDGRDLLTSYVGNSRSQQALEQNQAGPLALAAADFDEDGIPDLVGGYASATGLVTIDRGNPDTLYRNSNTSAAPFLSTARIFELGSRPDFIGTGDFDADGHNDVLVAARGSNTLYLLPGDGHGNFGLTHEIQLDGQVTALVTGEINRRDGLLDFVVAIEGANGPRLLVFEGPQGAVRAQPEIFFLPAPANQLALGQLDHDYPIDLAISAGHSLHIIHGRDRRLTLDSERQVEVPSAIIETRSFPDTIVSIAIGDFVGNRQSSLAALTDDGTVQVLSRSRDVESESTIQKASTGFGDRLVISQELLKQYEAGSNSRTTDRNNPEPTRTFADWESYKISSGQWPQATQLAGVHVSGLPGDDLLVMDSSSRQLHILTESRRQNTEQVPDLGSTQFNSVSLTVESAPVAVLPLLLDGDALQDLVILRDGQSAPAVTFTGQTADSLRVSDQTPSSTQQKKPEREPGPVAPPQTSQDERNQPQTVQQPLSEKARGKNERVQTLGIQPSFGSCPSTSISYGQTLTGALASTDCPFGDGSYFDDYSFTGTAGQKIAVSMKSTAFDTYLLLLAPDGSTLETDDDGGGGTDSYIPSDGTFFTLPSSGTFTIRANSIFANATGSYTVALTLQSAGSCPSTLVSLGQTINGSLSATDCHITSGLQTNSYVDLYRFNGTAGQQIAISMSSSFDTFLYLVDPANSAISDDDSGGGTNSRIPASGFYTLPGTGVYVIYATSFDAFTTGNYTLVLSVPASSTDVTNINDSGAGSLRQAIINANATSAPDTITFHIGSGAKRIDLLSALPSITSPVTIDGGTQPGYVGTPLIELNGLSAGANAAGLKITAGSSRVHALIINRFTGSGILLTTNGGNIVDGNYIGTNSTGNGVLGNAQFGIQIDSSNNTVGGTTTAARNIISGTGTSGIRFYLADGNTVRGNYIGTDITGTLDLGNTLNGVFGNVGSNNTIAGNLISGNNFPGIALFNTGPAGTLVQGNFIGTNAAGTAALPNEQDGIIVGGFAIGGDCPGCPNTATDNTIGGTSASLRNIISGNHGNGVAIINLYSERNNLLGNYIGTNAAGTAAVRNTPGSGVVITRAPNNTIGGAIPEAGNVISGNAQYGIAVGIPRTDPVSGQTIIGGTGVKIQFNLIGTTFDRVNLSPLGNLQGGIYLDAATVTNTIQDNIIAFNGGNGITIPANSNPGVQITITSNKIFGNSSTAIDLGNPGDTANDDFDADTGANTQQNYPELQTAVPNVANTDGTKRGEAPLATSVTVNYKMRSARNSTFNVEFFASNGSCVGKQFTDAKGERIGSESVTTDANGVVNRNITLSLPATVNTPQWLLASATATNVPAGTLGASNGNTSELSQCLAVGATPANVVQLSTSSYNVVEDCTTVTITVNRSGDTSGAASVDYATTDATATERRDYITAVGKLIFAPGESSKGIAVLINEDAKVEGSETFNVTLSNPSGMTLGNPTVATVTINDDPTESTTNTIDDPQNYVCEHYHDFLNRAPDAGGLAFWTNEITSCGADQACIALKRVNVSAAFYLSIEFQGTGYLVERIYKASYGSLNGTSTFNGSHSLPVPIVRLSEFLPDTQKIGLGVIVNQGNWQQQLEDNKNAFTAEFVQRSRFTTAFPSSMTAAEYVDKLNTNAGNPLSPAERNQLVTDLGTNAKTRAQVLRAVADDQDLNNAEFNRAFVLMQYFGYLRRNPNDPQDTDYTGYDFWLTKLNNFTLPGDAALVRVQNADMVKAFITSGEYRNRFGP